jgi:hypothetical protein
MMEAEYYYSREGERFGPVPGEQLKQLAATGQLEPHDLVWKQGMANWVEAARVKGLFPSAPQPPDVGVPPPAPSSREDGGPAAGSYPPAGRARETEESDAAKRARQAKDAALAAGTDAVKAFKVLVKNPVGGLKEAYETLGPMSAMSVGIVFAGVFVLCYLIGSWIGPSGFPGLSIAMKELLLAVLVAGVAIGGCAAAQGIFKGEGGPQAAIFVGGAGLLPLAVASLLLLILAKSFLILIIVIIFAITTSTIMLYSGCTTVLRVSEIVATVLVPLIFIVALILGRILLEPAVPPTFPM